MPNPTAALLSCLVSLGLTGLAAAEGPIRVVATVPDLGSLVGAVGGDDVEVTVLVKGPQDAHFIEPRPSFVRKLHKADLYLQVGMELEIGWAPVLLQRARNPKIRPGGAGFVDASTVIAPLEVPSAGTDRTAGDVHPFGNPHFLSDPVNGWRVAALLRDRLAELHPPAAGAFAERHAAFERRLLSALVGPTLLQRHAPGTLVRLVEDGRLETFLAERGERDDLGGWLGQLRGARGTKTVQDHRMWAYFARRFGLVLKGELEPKPGIAPTTRHLTKVVERMQAQGIRLVLSSPYFDPRHARWVAEKTGAKVAKMAHQVGARPGTDDYLAMLDYNVRQLKGAL